MKKFRCLSIGSRQPDFRRNLRIIVIVIFFSCQLTSITQAQQSDDVLVFSNATLPPVTNTAGNGYLDRIANEMFARAGLDYQLLKIPPARGLVQANAGSLDGEIARTNIPTEFQTNLLTIPESIIDVVFAGLYVSPEISVQTPEDFDRYRVGYVRGWKIAESMFDGDSNATPVSRAELLIDMLAAGRIDIAFLTIRPGQHMAKARNLEHLQVTDYQIRKQLYTFLHVNHAEKMNVLTEALVSMKADGSYQKIMNNFENEHR